MKHLPFNLSNINGFHGLTISSFRAIQKTSKTACNKSGISTQNIEFCITDDTCSHCVEIAEMLNNEAIEDGFDAVFFDCR